jgi:hypothetical protein
MKPRPAVSGLHQRQRHPMPLEIPMCVAPDQSLLFVAADLIEVIDFLVIKIVLTQGGLLWLISGGMSHLSLARVRIEKIQTAPGFDKG